MPVFDRVCAEASRAPGKTAFAIGAQALSYKRLLTRARAVRRALAQQAQLRPGRFGMPEQGRLLAVSLGNHACFPEIFVAAGSAPNCVAVLDPGLPPAQLHEIVPRLMPDLVITDRQTAPLCRIAARCGLKVVCTDEAENRDFSYAHWLDSASGANDPPVIADPQGPFLIGLTSGSTACPKAFIRSRQSWVKALEQGARLFNLGRETATLAPGPLAHGVSLYALAETLHAGATFITMPSFHAGGVLSLLQKGVRRLVAVPAVLHALGRRAVPRGKVFPEVAQLVAGGAAFGQHHCRAAGAMFPHADVWQYYGASELGFVALGKAADTITGDSAGAARVGRAFPSVKITIRDGSGQVVPAGVTGVVYVESELICGGYLWGDDGKSFRRTAQGATVGDIGFVDNKGCLSLVGRAGGMIVSGGHNIYPGEIETVLKKLAGVEDAVAFGLSDAALGMKPVAVLSFSAGAELAEKEIFAFCAAFLPKCKIPKNIYVIKRWPRTASGKIARGILEKMISARSNTPELPDDR